MKRMIIFSIATLALFTFLSTGTLAAAPVSIEVTRAPAIADTSNAADVDLIDLNSASLKELRSLPGIGRVYSKKIVEGRPYNSVRDLQTRKVLPKGTYAKIERKVTATTETEGDVLAKTR